MKFFTLLPRITYDNGQYDIRNLFWKYYFSTDISEEYLTTYQIKDADSLESICYNLYEDSSLWWLIAILNGIRDVVFDLPLSEDSLQELCRSISLDEVGDLDLDLYIANYDLMVIENDAKRFIRVIKPDFIQKILTEVVRQAQ